MGPHVFQTVSCSSATKENRRRMYHLGKQKWIFLMEKVSTFFWTHVFLAGEVQSPPLWIFPWTNVWSCHREKENMTNWPMWPPLGQKLFGQCPNRRGTFQKGASHTFSLENSMGKAQSEDESYNSKKWCNISKNSILSRAERRGYGVHTHLRIVGPFSHNQSNGWFGRSQNVRWYYMTTHDHYTPYQIP